MSRKIRKQKVAGTKSREVAQYFCATISSRDFLFPRLFVPIRSETLYYTMIQLKKIYLKYSKPYSGSKIRNSNALGMAH